MTDIDEVVRLIRAAKRVAVAAHVAPDGDAIGALLAIGRALESLGKQVVLLCDDPVPVKVRFLPGSEAVSATLGDFEPDLLIGVDVNEASRLGEPGHALWQAGLPTINIDHHITNDGFGTVNLVDPKAVSTTELLPPLFDALGVPLDEAIATCLLTGLVTDTRGFRTPNVTACTLDMAGRLMGAGADLPRIIALALDRTSLPELLRMGEGLRNTRMEERVIWTSLSSGKKNDVYPSGLASTLLGVEGVDVSAVFRERKGGGVEISLRASPGFNVADIAASLGGGGHKLAAGATVDGPLKAVVGRVVPLLKQAARDGAAEK